MPTYDLGDGIELEKFVYVNNVLTAASVTLAVTKPDGSVIAPAVTNPSLGTYLAETVPLDQTGSWSYVWTVSGAVIDHDAGTFTVADPAPPAYTTSLLVKAGLGKTTVDDRDDLIESATLTSSRMIDERTGRRFYLDAAVSSRVYTQTSGSGRVYFDPKHMSYVISVDDIGMAAGLIVEVGSTASGAWSPVTGYTTGPDNAITRGRPITSLIMPYGWAPSLWLWEIRVTARWGWPAVPAQIAEASRMLAARLYRRKDSPQGVIGNAEWGLARVSRLDPDVEALVAPFTLPGFA